MSEVTSPIILNSTGQDIALALAGLATAIANKPDPATQTPVMDGAGDVGASTKYAREDHQHPSDTAKQNKITASGILKGDGQGGVTAATPGTDYATPAQLAEKAKYTQYYITTARTVTHTVDKSCMFIIMTERISTGNPQSDEFGFGYCSITNAQTNKYHQIHAPTSDPVTITPGQGYLAITPSVSNTRITVIEFTDNV